MLKHDLMPFAVDFSLKIVNVGGTDVRLQVYLFFTDDQSLMLEIHFK